VWEKNPKRKPFRELVANKIKDKLTRSKGRFLSFARRICLLKSVLTLIPLYYMSLFKMLILVSEDIMKIPRKFLWGWGVEGRKITCESGQLYVNRRRWEVLELKYKGVQRSIVFQVEMEIMYRRKKVVERYIGV